MKISILLPYKENFSPEYPGAVSLFVNDTSLVSRYQSNIKVYGSTKYKKKFKIKYVNIKLSENFIGSQSKQYIDKFIEHEKKDPSNIIEIHNRPFYLKKLSKGLNKRMYTLFFHNDPLSMEGSKSLPERQFLLQICSTIAFNSRWSKNRFLEGLDIKNINSETLKIFFQSASKSKISIIKKKKIG